MPGNDLIKKDDMSWHCGTVMFCTPALYHKNHCLLKSKELQQLSGKDPPKDWNFLCHAGAVNFL